MSIVRICFLFLLLLLTIVPLSMGEHQVLNGYTFIDVHTWPDSKCIACHTTDKPDAASHTLTTEDISLLCGSCHKETVTILPGLRLRSSIEVMHNHPIKSSLLDFDPKRINNNIIKEGQYYYVSAKEGKLPLFGKNRTSSVTECTTCHDPHGKARNPKLHYIDNSKGQACVICHIIKGP